MFAGCPLVGMPAGYWGWGDDTAGPCPPAPSTAATEIIRAVRADDMAALNSFFLALSPRSRRLRFHGAVNVLPPAALQRLSAPDDATHATLVVEADVRLIGEARYIVDPAEPTRAEFALAIADEWQGRGLGRRLLHQLLQRAREQGLSALHGSVLDENTPMLTLVQAMGGRAVRAPGAGYAIEWQLPTAPYSSLLSAPPSNGMPPSLWLPSSPLRV